MKDIDYKKYGIDIAKITEYASQCYHQFMLIENNTGYKPTRLFVCGLSGSGKDTIADYFKVRYNFAKLRLASTIKNYICETNGFAGYDELEFWKRQKPDIRRLHTTVGDVFNKEAEKNGHDFYKSYSLNVMYQLITRQHGTFELCERIPYDYIICDVRMPEEITLLLETGHFGIFLTRTTDEYQVKGHVTETNIFTNGLYEDLKSCYGNQMFVINNPCSEFITDYQKEFYKKNLVDNVWNLEKDAVVSDLLSVIEGFVKHKITKYRDDR